MTNTELREQIIQELQSTLVEDWMSAKVRAESCAKFAETIQSTMSDEVLDKLRAVLVKHGAQETELPAAVAQVVANKMAPGRQIRERQWKNIQRFERTVLGWDHGNN